MTKTIKINGLDVEFSEKVPTRDGVYWVLYGVFFHTCAVENGYVDGTGTMPSETNYLWSAALVPAVEVRKAWAESWECGANDGPNYEESRARKVVEGF
jgi:hypothetical protein